jgi:hypothetical protein
MLNISLFQGPGLFEPIHGSAPDIAGQVVWSTHQIYIILNDYMYFHGESHDVICRIRQTH